MKLVLGMMAIATLTVPQQRPAPVLASIEMETTSWGRLVARWSIDASGDLRFTAPEANGTGGTRFVTRLYHAGTAGFRRIRVMIGAAEARGGVRMPCDQAVTDAIYGSVKWTQPNGRFSKLNFYTACRQFETRRVVGELGKANQIAQQWAMQGQIIETKPGDTPQ